MILDSIQKGQNKTQDDFRKEILYKAVDWLIINKILSIYKIFVNPES